MMNTAEFITYLYQENNSEPLFPNKKKVETFVEELFAFLFTPHASSYVSESAVGETYDRLRLAFRDLLAEQVEERKTKSITDEWFDALPEIYRHLLNDAKAILEFDPAATSLQEVLRAYPGFFATAVYRIAHQLNIQKVSILPRLFTAYAHSKTGIDIHPGARIGKAFSIDHGTGVVIGESAIIGNNVKIYQGVTLGALNVTKENARAKRHPTIEDNVIIYSGASILGGNTIVGHDSVIGGNVWLTNSVAPFSVVFHKNEVLVRDKNSYRESLNFSI